MSASGHVRLDLTRSDGVVVVELDRPAKLNALTMSMVRELEQLLISLDVTAARALVVRASGKVFSVGADLGEVSQHDAVAMFRDWLTVGHRVFAMLQQLPIPTVARIHGLALGGGLELALACDLRVMASDAEIGLPEVGIGAIPAWGGLTRVTQLAGAARASDLILTRRRLTAREAVEWGLVTRVAEPADLDAGVEELLAQLLAGSPVAQLLAKRAIAAAVAGAPAALVEPMAGGMAQATQDITEGIAAFRERREPQFRNR